MYARLWKHANIFTSKKLVSTFPQRAGIPGSTSWSHGPGWALDTAPPPRCWGKVETAHRCVRVAVPGKPGRCPPGRLSMPRWSHGTAWHFLHLWNWAALVDASAVQCTGAFLCSIRHRLGTGHRCFPPLPERMRPHLVTGSCAGQVCANTQVLWNSWSQAVAHRTLINIVGFSLWRYRAIAGLTNTDN